MSQLPFTVTLRGKAIAAFDDAALAQAVMPAIARAVGAPVTLCAENGDVPVARPLPRGVFGVAANPADPRRFPQIVVCTP